MDDGRWRLGQLVEVDGMALYMLLWTSRRVLQGLRCVALTPALAIAELSENERTNERTNERLDRFAITSV
jgi:hypothetical protein